MIEMLFYCETNILKYSNKHITSLIIVLQQVNVSLQLYLMNCCYSIL